MGKIKQGVLGGFSGKVGPVTGSGWKGIHVIKSRPTSVAYPGTAAQVAQTSKMSGVVAFAKPLLSPWIKPLWDRFAVQKSGYNDFVKSNIANFVNGELTDIGDLTLSKGSMVAVPLSVSANVGQTEFTVTWDNAAITDPLALSTDVAYAVLLAADGTYMGSATNATRADETISIILPAATGAGNFYAFLAFKAANGTRVSNSTYDSVLVGG